MSKACTACAEVKSLDQFPPDRRGPRGVQAQCRACINAWMKVHYRKNPAWSMIRRAKARAAKKGLDFDLTLEDVTPLPEVCPVLGVPLRMSTDHRDPWTYSLDRIDNSRGYVRGNVMVMSYHANRLKNDGTADEHEKIAAWMRRQETRAAERVTVVV